MHANPCLRCGLIGHVRPKCRKPKAKCKYCQGDHLHFFCENQPDDATGDRRDELSDGAITLIARDCERMRRRPTDTTTPDTPTEADWTNQAITASAHTAAAMAAARHTDPMQAANAYAAALRGLGWS